MNEHMQAIRDMVRDQIEEYLRTNALEGELVVKVGYQFMTTVAADPDIIGTLGGERAPEARKPTPPRKKAATRKTKRTKKKATKKTLSRSPTAGKKGKRPQLVNVVAGIPTEQGTPAYFIYTFLTKNGPSMSRAILEAGLAAFERGELEREMKAGSMYYQLNSRQCFQADRDGKWNVVQVKPEEKSE
jgi:hypothetical protein